MSQQRFRGCPPEGVALTGFLFVLSSDPDIDYVMLAKSQGIEGIHVHEPQELEAVLRRGCEVTAGGEPYLLDVHVCNMGAGSDSTWYQEFKLRP